MRPKTITVTGDNDPYVIPLNYRADHTAVHCQVSGTIDYTVSYTVQNVHSIASPATNADWVDITDMTAATGNETAKIDMSISAVKVVVNSGDGSVDITVSHPG